MKHRMRNVLLAGKKTEERLKIPAVAKCPRVWASYDSVYSGINARVIFDS